MTNQFSWLPASFLQFIIVAIAIAQVVIIFALAIAVLRDADKRIKAKRGLFLVAPIVWGGIVLFTGGYGGALAYWLIHYSILKAKVE